MAKLSFRINFDKSIPAWTWWAPFLILAFAKVIAKQFFFTNNFFWIYLPYVVAVILYVWWGPRVFWAHALAETLTAGLMGFVSWGPMLLFGFANAAKVLFGYALFRQVASKIPLKSWRGLGYFAFWMLVMQNVLGNFLFMAISVGTGRYGTDYFWQIYFTNTAKDFFEALLICYPVLIFGTRRMQERGLALHTFVLTESDLQVRTKSDS